ncbi:MAG: hypothetical protein HY710_01180 [Candidatus Latescibacteria bacterium]|nr:hypothetical protein [Candidatus Latescibacterota bacterium]
MTRVEKLEQEVRKLNQAQLAAFRQWFYEYEATKWERQIEKDVRSGKLDKLADEALVGHSEKL